MSILFYRHERSSRKIPTTVNSTSDGRANTAASDSRSMQSTSSSTSSSSQGIRPRLPSDAASRANSSASQRAPSESPASPLPIQAMRPRVLSDAASRMASQRLAADASPGSPPVSQSSTTTQTSSSRTCANASRATVQPAQPKSPSPVQADRRIMSPIPDGQKTVAQLQSERAAQQLQFRPSPPNQQVRPGLSAIAQARAAAQTERNVRRSPPTVGTQTAAVSARTNAGQTQPQGIPSRQAQVPSAPVSVRQRVPAGQVVAGSPPAHNGLAQRVRSPSSPQPGAQDGSIASDGGNVVKPRGSPVMGQGSPRGVPPSATPPQSTPPQVEAHISAKAKRLSAQMPATEVRLQQAPKPRRHSESDNDPLQSRRTLLAKTNTHHPPQCNPQLHLVASSSAVHPQSSKSHSSTNVVASVTTSQNHPSSKQSISSSTGQAVQTKPSSPSVHRVFDLSLFSIPPNTTAPDCSVPLLANPGKMDKVRSLLLVRNCFVRFFFCIPQGSPLLFTENSLAPNLSLKKLSPVISQHFS